MAGENSNKINLQRYAEKLIESRDEDSKGLILYLMNRDETGRSKHLAEILKSVGMQETGKVYRPEEETGIPIVDLGTGYPTEEEMDEIIKETVDGKTIYREIRHSDGGITLQEINQKPSEEKGAINEVVKEAYIPPQETKNH